MKKQEILDGIQDAVEIGCRIVLEHEDCIVINDHLKQLSETEERLKRICKAVVEESELSGDGITLEIYNDVYDCLENKE